jgi:hypothetical protein
VFLLVSVVGLGLGFSTAGRSTAQDKAPPEVAQKEPFRDKAVPPKDGRDDRVDEKVADEKLKADRLVQLAELQAKYERLLRESEVNRADGLTQLQAKEVEVEKLRDENALLKDTLAKTEAQAEMQAKRAEEKERLAIVSLQAEKDLKTAAFYRASGHPESAAFYYELVIRRFPGTSYAKEAAKLRDELFDKFEKEQGGAAANPQLREENERLKQQYEKARKEADDLRGQIEQLRRFLEKKPPESAKE